MDGARLVMKRTFDPTFFSIIASYDTARTIHQSSLESNCII